MFSSDIVSEYNIENNSFKLINKVWYEDNFIHSITPSLMEIGVHPWRWKRVTAPIDFTCKLSQLQLPPFFIGLVKQPDIRKSLIIYSYLCWKINLYKKENRVGNEDFVVMNTKKSVDELFIQMVQEELGPNKLTGIKLFVMKILVTRFNNKILDNRSFNYISGRM